MIPRHFKVPRRRDSASAPDRPPAALGAMLEGEDFANTPLGGWDGEMLPSVAPQPPAKLELVGLPAPEWEDARGNLDLDQLAPLERPPEPVPDALSVLKAEAGDIEEPRAPGPPLKIQPLERPRVPEPDWQLEQQERAEQAPEPPAPKPAPPLFIAPPPWK